MRSEFLNDLIAGSCGGAAQIVVGHPFDTVKVKLQSVPAATPTASAAEMVARGAAALPAPPPSAMNVVRQILAAEGVQGLFKGMGAPLATVSCLNAVLFSANGFLRGTARQLTNTQAGQPLSMEAYAACGGGAGIFVSMIACPTELVKCRLQAQSAGLNVYSGPLDCARQILANKGIAGLFKGLQPTLLREVPGGVAYFTGYETSKKLLTPEHGKPSKFTLMFSGGVAGVCYWALVYPADLIKTRIQTDSDLTPRYRGIIDCARQVYREGGLRGLYRGATPGILRSFPANAVCFIIYEAVVQHLKTEA
eukprot:Plantae.Rhodophyta-Purpureofilum_apyrenoidigerum.ctg19820.p1 GENE.Plantae.Rhodophyta-Purpureofilum_apyrenoidigerum.ctg19820~~Plantae.Rhodophyta-Purpureofilum_apyrenoidigerum.ctg19820.p1  ORF type:complete len:308 (+),score=30.49 Plantae.Rhodophyta-Purpureofilum_apyrenoidigerum.ctg19820:99-1022(+)